mmetsp:Transcript_17655/g.57726  ORF Transcript_17655/g.57726 Transcript_17655/m.57726 type:complete len:346 (-) Transcript_17655:81-1118(-)
MGRASFASLALAAALLACSVSSAGATERPLIGILSQPTHDEGHANDEYIAASYVKFVEAAGARAVPVVSTSNETELKQLFSSINGLVFPGGGSDLSKGTALRTAAETLLKLAMDSNDAGDPFPIWGTCMGFQLLLMMVSGDENLLEHFPSINVGVPLTFQVPPEKTRLYGSSGRFPPDLLDAIQKQGVPFENHHWGVDPARFAANSKLSDFFGGPLTTSVDDEGKVYASSVEAKAYPFYGSQYHPEKNTFEWFPDLRVDHGLYGVELTHAAASVLVQEARKSKHEPNFAEQELLDIANYNPEFTGATSDPDHDFDQVYFFPQKPKPERRAREAVSPRRALVRRSD